MAYFSPTLNFNNDEGLKYAVSLDNETPQIICIEQRRQPAKDMGQMGGG